MIPSIHSRGIDAGGLLRYLYGPGKQEEHSEPHLVGAWGWENIERLEPRIADGRHDLRDLTDTLNEPIDLTAGNGPPKPVWHCSVRLHPSDPTLDDQTWEGIARRVVAAAGIAVPGDDGGVRWVAVRHAPDHIHIVATLVRQDGRREEARGDRWRVQAAARDLETELGLYQMGPRDSTTAKNSHRVEVAKAQRDGHVEPARDRLRRLVRTAVAASATPEGFLARLAEAGVNARLRRVGEAVVGYTVALPDVTTAAGEPVRYSGGKLAADLTWPRVQRRLALVESGEVPADPVREAARAVDAAAASVQCDLTDESAPGVESIGQAAGQMVTVLAASGSRPNLVRAADRFDHAVRAPGGRILDGTPEALRLQAMGRMLATTGRTTGDDELMLVLGMIRNLSRISDTIAQLRDLQNRPAQARAAREAASLMRDINVGGQTPSRRSRPPTAAGFTAGTRAPRRTDTHTARR